MILAQHRPDHADSCDGCDHPSHAGICSVDRCGCGLPAHARAATLEQLAARARTLDARLAQLRRAGL